MNLKKGDTLTCKYSSDFVPLKVGKTYIIKSIFDNWTDNYYSISISYDKIFSESFSSNPINSMYLYTYFYTEQELRKVKLEKLSK